MKNITKLLKAAFMWLPFVVFFSIVMTMLASQFKNPTDEYFVATILRACLLLITATFVAHIFCIGFLMVVSYSKLFSYIPILESGVKTLFMFPIVDIGIYSTALFISPNQFVLWYQILVVLLIVPTLSYWLLFLKGPIRNLHQFAMFHQVKQYRITNVLSSFYIAAGVDYFFIVLKKTLLPLVFILTVMDFKIMLPRLVDAGLSITSLVMFFSLILSLHLLTFGKERVR